MSGTYSTEADFLRGALDWWNGPIASSEMALVFVRPTADRTDVIRHAVPFEDVALMGAAFDVAKKAPGAWNYIAMLNRKGSPTPVIDSIWNPPTPLKAAPSTAAKVGLGVLGAFGVMTLLAKAK